MRLRWRHHKARIDHAQWCKNPLLHKGIKALPSDDLNQSGQHIGGHRILPALARLVHQWQISQCSHQASQRMAGAQNFGVDVGLINQCARKKAIAQARGVGEQMPISDGTACRLSIVNLRSTRFEHAAIGQLGQQRLNRIIQRQLALLHQQQNGARRYQLGVRKYPKQVVRAQKLAALLVCPARTMHVQHIAPAQHRAGYASQYLAIHITLHGAVQRSEIVRMGDGF